MLPVIYEVVTIGTGKLSVMAMPVGDNRIGEEIAGLRQLGIDHVVSLLEVEEQSEVGLEDEEVLCIQNGIRYTSFPITDRDVPQKVDALALAARLNRDISNGDHVVVHCRAGVGRTGVIASAVLIQAGYSSGEAIHMVSFARGSLVPETEEQDNWIRSIERSDG